MKAIKLFLIIPLIAALSGTAAKANAVSLKIACDNKLVKLNIHGTSQSHGECMQIEVTNLTNKALNLTLETGRKFICTSDTTSQNMMVTQELLISLNGKEKKTYTAYAFCIQKAHSTPDYDSYYKIGPMAEGYLLQLARLIEKYHYQDYAAQQALWRVIDKGDSAKLYLGTANIEEANALKRFVTLAKANRPIFTEFLFPGEDDKQNFLTRTGYNISGEIRWEMENEGYASLAVYDEKGNHITDIFLKKEYEEGTQLCSFKVVSCLIEPDKKYIVRLKIEEQTIGELACVGK